MRQTIALLTCLLALVATSCSQFPGTDDSALPRNDALIDAMANDIIFHVDPVTRDAGEAGCIARGVFGLVGAARLTEAGVTIESADLVAADLSANERASVTKVVTECTGPSSFPDGSVDLAAAGASSTIGSTDGGDAQARLVDNMVADLMSDPNAPVSTRAEARCMIEGTIDLLGLDAAGVEDMAYSDSDPTRQESNAMVDAYARCADVIVGFAGELENGGFHTAEASCVAKQFGRANIVQMMKNSLDLPEGVDLDPADEVALFAAMDRCGI